MKRHVLPLLVLLAACGTPQEQCIRAGTRDLRTLDRLIAETEGNLDRGYALEDVTITQEHWGYCEPWHHADDPTPSLVPCLIEHDVTVRRPIAIDLADEAKKLESLKARRGELARAAEPIIAQCKADHPE